VHQCLIESLSEDQSNEGAIKRTVDDVAKVAVHGRSSKMPNPADTIATVYSSTRDTNKGQQEDCEVASEEHLRGSG